jgi:hypothetical protein
MKTKIFTIAAAVIATLSSSAFASINITTLPAIGSFNKIEVHGNVELVIANGEKNTVEVSNNYYAENAAVQNSDGTLRIASYSKEKLTVYVTANDLRTIEAFDNATVKSEGCLSAIEMEVSLHNTAYAALKLDNFSANVTIDDSAKADLTGDVTEYTFNHSKTSKINQTALVAENSVEKVIMPLAIKTAPTSNDDLLAIAED